MLSCPLPSRLQAILYLFAFWWLWEGLALSSSAQADPFLANSHRSETSSPARLFPQLSWSRPLGCPSLQQFSYNPETAQLEWAIEQPESGYSWAVLIDPAGQPATLDLTGSLGNPAPGSWMLLYGARSCSYQATATLDIPQSLVCPTLEDFSYDTEAKKLRWAINPQGNTRTFVDIINPAGSVASHSLQGSLLHPPSGTWVMEYGARSGCDIMGVIFTEVPSAEALESLP